MRLKAPPPNPSRPARCFLCLEVGRRGDAWDRGGATRAAAARAGRLSLDPCPNFAPFCLFPGSLPPQDNLFRIFGGDRIKGLMSAFRIEDLPIESQMLTSALDEAQRKVGRLGWAGLGWAGSCTRSDARTYACTRARWPSRVHVAAAGTRVQVCRAGACCRRPLLCHVRRLFAGGVLLLRHPQAAFRVRPSA